MSSLFRHIALIFILALLGISCAKQSNNGNQILMQGVVVLPDKDIVSSITAVAGSGVALLAYSDELSAFKFKMIDNQGNELWTKEYDNSAFETFAVSLPVTILPWPGNNFDIFYGQSRLRINVAGDILSLDTTFLVSVLPPPINGLYHGISINKIVPGANDSYLVFGDYNYSGNRAFVAEVNQEGEAEFQKFYAFNVNGTNRFTDGFPLDSGGYLLAGSHIDVKTTFFIQRLNASGNVLYTHTNEIENGYMGQEFIQTADGNYAYLLSPVDENTIDPRSRLYALNDTAGILGVSYLNLARFNIGRGMAKSQDGSFTGIMNDKDESNNAVLTFTQPQYTYCYGLDANGTITYQKYLNRAFTTDYTSITELSDGRILVFGTSFSFGEENRLSLLFK